MCFRDRVVGPILRLKNKLFQTFRERRSIVQTSLHLSLQDNTSV